MSFGWARLDEALGSNNPQVAMNTRLSAPVTDEHWQAYHAIRRRVLFELRGNGGAYDERHPDEHRLGHYPFVLWDAETPVGVIRVDIVGVVATFRRVAIRDDLQQRGYGRELMTAAEVFARAQMCLRIDSYVDPSAVTFYERCGFIRADAANAQSTPIPMTKALS